MSLSELSEQAGKVESLISPCAYVSDPLAAFHRLCADNPNSLLLESAEIDSKDDLKSLLLIDAALKLVCRSNQVVISALSDNGASVLPLFEQLASQSVDVTLETNQVIVTFHPQTQQLDEDTRLKAPFVLDSLRFIIQQIDCLRDHPQALFLGGVFAYDLLAEFEQLPSVAEGDNDCPNFVFYLAETLLLIDHKHQQTELIASVFSGANVAQHFFSINQRIEQIKLILEMPSELTTNAGKALWHSDLRTNVTDEQFCQQVIDLKQHILAGDIFQVVPSRTFSLPCPSPVLAYQTLKAQNPSPYMFYMQDSDFSIFGASPESALKYEQVTNQVEVYPIAGTRPRGKHADGSLDPDLDSRFELSLQIDEKERAEHIMLVDLARNDIAKVSQPGTRHVKDLLKVDRYSHVMHLVSRVTGQLRDDLDALHAYQACMNMGTLVGAPKVSAASLIRHTEKKRRGSYGGAVGYLNRRGDMDTCIVIRSAFVKNGVAYIQAGAGVVSDSTPQAEADETRNKAQAVINAIVSAHCDLNSEKNAGQHE